MSRLVLHWKLSWLLLLSTLTHKSLLKKYSGINISFLLKFLQANSPILLLLRGHFHHKVWLHEVIFVLHVDPLPQLIGKKKKKLPQLGATILLRHVHQNCLYFFHFIFLIDIITINVKIDIGCRGCYKCATPRGIVKKIYPLVLVTI